VNLSSFLFGNDVQNSSDTFVSEGHRITVDHFLPQGRGPFPAVIALHGSGGSHAWAAEPARMLAGRGFGVFVLHYFERTGTAWADDATIRGHFPTWMKTIGDAITYAGRQREVDAEHIALLGFSLGGYLALSVASVDPRVKAVVEYFGGLPEELSNFRQMPPTLILHGDADPVVPVAEAQKLQTLFERAGTTYDMKIYSGQGHSFNGTAVFDAGMRTLNFLNKHLRNGKG
jgi:carboxymethylenebutenolidase